MVAHVSHTFGIIKSGEVEGASKSSYRGGQVTVLLFMGEWGRS